MLSWRRDKKDEAGGATAPPAESHPPTVTGKAAPAPPPASTATAPRLGELLVQEGVITAQQLHEGLTKQAETGSFIGHTLVELGFLNQSTLVSFLVKQCKIPHISLLDYNIGEDLFKLVSRELCLKHRLLPIDKLGRILTIAMVDPLDADALEKVRESCPELKIKPILCTWAHYEQVSRRIFADTSAPSAEVSMGTFGLSSKKTSIAPADKTQADAAVAQLVKEATASKPMQETAGAPAKADTPPPAVRESAAAARMELPDAIFDRFGDHMRLAITESLSPLIADQQKLIALQLETTKGKPADLARDIAANMRAALQESLATVLETHSRLAPQSAPHQQIDTGLLAKELGESVRAAMLDSVLPALQLGDGGTPKGQSPVAGIDAKTLARELGESVRTAVAESIAPLAKPLNGGESRAAKSAFDMPDLAKELTAGVRDAVMEAIVPLVQAQKATVQAGARAPEEIAKHFAQHINRSMAQLSKELRESIESRAPQTPVDSFSAAIASTIESANAKQNTRMAELTNSTKDALLAVREMLEAMRAREAEPLAVPASNVSPFPGLRAAEPVQAIAVPHFDPMDEIGLGAEADDRVREALLSGRLQRSFSFDAFLSGAANTFTLSVARAVTESYSREFTPFYIYGDVGVGKTHLLQAIGNDLLARNPDLRVAYMTGLRFVSACERAARDQELERFRETFAHWDALLFDDAQSVSEHKQAQDELRTVLGVLTLEGRLVVVSADRAPDHLPDTSHQLVSRLASGIVSRLHAPDMPTRLAILQRHTRLLKAKIADDVLSLIAARVPTDVRKMTGALRKALAFAQVSGTDVTHALAEEILSHLATTEAA
ncbi:MAG: DnaA/Hda family protein [Candidatus Hydrogenedentes bacterium]|nr:DnaA/Hda family protein [Candidatus Hydrogenedentota bacterium]